MADEQLTYEDMIEYLSDRDGEHVICFSYPSFSAESKGERITSLGLKINGILGKIEAVPQAVADHFLEGRAGASIPLYSPDAETMNAASRIGELILTREWFGGALLDESSAYLRVFVFADPDREPLYPPIGEERDSDERRDVSLVELVGWGFAFDFDGSPPFSGRWAREEAS